MSSNYSTSYKLSDDADKIWCESTRKDEENIGGRRVQRMASEEEKYIPSFYL